MKVRQGFVSNSSTSSFICNICDETYTGWDASPYDDGGTYCEYGHAICGTCWEAELKETKNEDVVKDGCEHEFDRESMKFCPECGAEAKITVTVDDLIEEYDEIPARFCPVCRFEVYDNGEMAKYLEKTREVSRDEVFAKVKEKNRRRRKLYDEEYISYVVEKFDITDDAVLEEIKEKFKTFNEYRRFLSGR